MVTVWPCIGTETIGIVLRSLLGGWFVQADCNPPGDHRIFQVSDEIKPLID